MIVFKRALLKELTNLALAVFVTLLVITITTLLVRLLSQAASGKLLPEAVIALLGFSSLNYFPILLSLTLFISILMTLSRGYRDSEMVVWFSSGLSLTSWIKPVIIFAAPLVIVIALLSLFLSPWALGKSEEYRQKLKTQEDVASISPGVFRESSRADRVFFVEAIAGDETNVQNIFISSTQHQKLGIMVSKRGFQETASNGDRFLVLLHGRRYEGTPGLADYRIMDFERYAIRVEIPEPKSVESSLKARSTFELIEHSTKINQAEFLWRIGLPLSALNLALLAIPLSFVNPRAGRSANLVFALLTYMVYSNLISITQAWVAQGRISFHIGWWLVHCLMFIVLLILFFKRLSIFPSLRFLFK